MSELSEWIKLIKGDDMKEPQVEDVLIDENICNSCIHRRVCQMRDNEYPSVKICIERVQDNGTDKG